MSLPGFTADSPWEGMYSKDKYARDRVMKATRLLLPYLKDNDVILDVGCFTQEAKKYFPPWVKYIGIDEKAYHKETRVVDLNCIGDPIPCSHALCLETLEHVLRPHEILSFLRKSVDDNGYIVISLPNEATLFHRLRCLFGVVDAQTFSDEGKHLHMPSLKQCVTFLQSTFDIVCTKFYISPSAVGSQQQVFGRILTLIPDSIHQLMADTFPSLFARGFIFLLKKKLQAVST